MKSKLLTNKTIIEKDGKYYHGYVPSLPGCHTQGDTVEETKKNLREAIEGYLLSLHKHGEPIPQEEQYESTEIVDIEKLFSTKASYA